jgi:hypothetical protein
MKASTIKLERFNNCPGALSVKCYLYDHNLMDCVKVVDVDEAVEVNDRDMVVLALTGRSETKAALAIGEMAVWFKAHELTWREVGGTYVIRLWWK